MTISRREFLGLSTATGLAIGTGLARGAPVRKPNTILIFTDDVGYGDLGIHGCTDIPTPHIDALAGSGMRCTNGTVCSAICAPSRAGLMTGPA